MNLDVVGLDQQSVGDIFRRTHSRRHHGHRALRDGGGDRRPVRSRDYFSDSWPKNLLIESIISFGIGLVITLVFCFFAAEILELNKKSIKRNYTYDVEIVIPKEYILEYGNDFDVQSLASHSWQAVRVLEKRNSQKFRLILGGNIQVVVMKRLNTEDPLCPICVFEIADYFKSNFWTDDTEYTNIISFQITPSSTFTDSLKCIEKHFA